MNADVATSTATDWGGAMTSFLDQKRKRSGSKGTSDAYGRILSRFFSASGKTPDQMTPAEVQSFCYGVGPSGKEPSSSTVALRLAAISSFYRHLIRMELLDRNPCERVERTRPEAPLARGLSPEEVQRLLAAIPDDTPVGKRDRALILTFVLTGRRRTEILSLTAGDLSVAGETCLFSYRGKGGKTRRRELPEPCFVAIVESLKARGKDMATMAPDEPLFDLSPHGFYMNLRRYLRKAGLPVAGVHVLRHTAAKLRRDAGETVEAVSEFLDHSNLAVTSAYLKRLVGQQDPGWRKVASLLS